MASPVKIVGFGDSIMAATLDEANRGGVLGRFLEDTDAHPQLGPSAVLCQGVFAIEGHPGHLQCGWGGDELHTPPDMSLLWNILNVPDGIPRTGQPLFGTGGLFQDPDFVFWCGGGGDIGNNDPVADTYRKHKILLNTLRRKLNETSPWCRIIVAGGYLDFNNYQASAAANNAVMPQLYDEFDAENPGQALVRGVYWRLACGDWSTTTYADDAHIKAAGFDRVYNTPQVPGTDFKTTVLPLVIQRWQQKRT